MDRILELAKAHGIKIVIDLHTGSGTQKNEVASNVLGDATNLETLTDAWRKIARHFRGHSQIYGYDLLNEPVPEKFMKGKANAWQYMAQTMADAIRENDKFTPIIVAWHQISDGFEIKGDNIIYTIHFYSPHAYTHQGLHSLKLEWAYPGMINNVYWNQDRIRLELKPFIEYQQKHHVKIYVGEFGCIAWAPGRAQYIKDCIEIFEEYGWDWTYHAFREYSGWSVEHEGKEFGKLNLAPGNPAQKVLLDAFRKNTSLILGNHPPKTVK